VNIQSLNSLLKFLEEPHDNIYAIFTCNNISNVLPTIKSRCQTYPIPKLYGIEKNYNPVELSVYNDYDMLIKDDTSGLFKELSEFVNKLLANNKIGQIKALSEQFKKMDYYDIAIVIKIVFYFKKKEVLLKMLDTLYLNPNKILLFNQILNSLN
jgi:DNA polymerase-3 subunit delta'